MAANTVTFVKSMDFSKLANQSHHLMRGTLNSINVRTGGLEQCWNHILKPAKQYVCGINRTDKADAIREEGVNRQDFRLTTAQVRNAFLTIWLRNHLDSTMAI